MSAEEKIYREKLVLASVFERFLAFLIDYFLISLVFTFIFWDELAPLKDNYASIMSFIEKRFLYFVGLQVCYEIIFVFLYGATLGKIALKIKVISLGILDRPNLIYSSIRAVGKIIGENLFYAPFFWIFFSPIQQTFHDILGQTLVIKNA